MDSRKSGIILIVFTKMLSTSTENASLTQILTCVLFMKSYLKSALLCCWFILVIQCRSDKATQTPIFELLSPDNTHVLFQNTLKEDAQHNLLLYEYFYNGGGVSVGDVNGDGLDDIYFTSNMESNKLYLNKGGMTFEDITASAFVEGRMGGWKTGTTMADVNGDGLLDIFVCYSGNVPPELRTKQLFINQGNNAKGIPHFVDMAKEYGLDNTSTTTQASFFDYDLDGDLDVVLLNHNIQNLPVLNVAAAKEILNQDDPISGIRLYRHEITANKDHYFTDVTNAANLSSSPVSFGLGIGVADFNHDGWQDMYISNDYSAPDYLYINNQKGGFVNQANESLDHFSQFSMGNDVADINNDGNMDIYTLDMLPEDNHRQKLLLGADNADKFDLHVNSGFGKQYMRNMLQLNISQESLNSSSNKLQFAEIGQLAGVSTTDWSWSALFADFDNDGWKDLYVTNGFLRDFTNLDFMKYMNNFITENQTSMSREKVMELVTQMPSSNVTNYLYQNKSDLTFQNVTESWGANQQAISSGAAYADLDNDGDLDLVVNNINQAAFIYENTSNSNNAFLQIELHGENYNRNGIGAKLSVWSNGQLQYQEAMPTHGYQSSMSNTLHVGFGKNTKIDSVKVTWLGGKTELLKLVKVNQKLHIYEKNAQNTNTPTPRISPIFQETDDINFVHSQEDSKEFKRQGLITNPLSFSGPCMTKGDINKDGLEDIYIGGGTGQSGAIYLQNKNGKFTLIPQTAFALDRLYYDTDAVFFDANGDASLDLYVCSGGYGNYQPNDPALQDRLYLNDGKGHFTKGILPVMLTSTSCVRVNDINGDHKPDLFVGGRVSVGQYPIAPESYILINNGKGAFTIQTPKSVKTLGMVTDAAWYDLDKDKVNELVIVGEGMPITVFKVTKGNFTEVTNTYFDKNYSGFWNKLLIDDFDGDGNPEMIVGNLGLNAQLKASDKEPIELVYGDIDKNGTIDPLLFAYNKGVSFPYLTRDELLEQLPQFRAKFTDYKSYADVTSSEILKDNSFSTANKLRVNCLKNMYFSQSKNGKFQEKALPIQTQFAPIASISQMDYNHDGKKDVMLFGNILHTRPKFGDYDANKGLVLKNTGNGNFQYVGHLSQKGDIRSSLVLSNRIILGINQAKVKTVLLN